MGENGLFERSKGILYNKMSFLQMLLMSRTAEYHEDEWISRTKSPGIGRYHMVARIVWPSCMCYRDNMLFQRMQNPCNLFKDQKEICWNCRTVLCPTDLGMGAHSPFVNAHRNYNSLRILALWKCSQHAKHGMACTQIMAKVPCRDRGLTGADFSGHGHFSL